MTETSPTADRPAASGSTTAERLAAFVTSCADGDIPAAVIEAERLHVLDSVGCGLAAFALDEAPFILASAAETDTNGPCTAIGMADGATPDTAALVNGTLIHALDFDDTHPDSVVHVSAAVVAAGLAAAEVAGSSAGALLGALVLGNETSIRLGMAAGGRFHARGFHPTGVCGVFGATVTAARLRGLDAAQTANALGIAGSMAGGLLEFLADGAKTKPLHPGWAAHAALSAVRLAAHGATGPTTIFDGARGFFGAYLHGETATVAEQMADLGERWETPDIAFKPYPACHYTHAPIDALARVMDEHGIRAGDVESIVALSDETGVGLVLAPLHDKLRPRTVYDAKFSLPYCLGAQLAHGRVEVGSFTPQAIAEADVLDLAARVTYEQKAYAPAPDAFPGGVRVSTRDGRTLEAELRHQRGGSENPMSRQDVVDKFRGNASLALDADRIADLERTILELAADGGLDGLPVIGRARTHSLAAAGG